MYLLGKSSYSFKWIISEVVYIGVIHPEHVRLSRMMLEAGKHVLCEKPLAESWEECRKVIDFARERKLLLVEV